MYWNYFLIKQNKFMIAYKIEGYVYGSIEV